MDALIMQSLILKMSDLRDMASRLSTVLAGVETMGIPAEFIAARARLRIAKHFVEQAKEEISLAISDLG